MHSPSLKLTQKKFFVGPWRGYYVQALLCGSQNVTGIYMHYSSNCSKCSTPDRVRLRRLLVTYWKSLETSVPRGSCAQVLTSPQRWLRRLSLDPVFHGESSKHDRLFGEPSV